MTTFTVADAFDATEPRCRINLNAPLPLGYKQALRRAMELRGKGAHMSYLTIADIMRDYHGVKRSPQWWSRELRAQGAEPKPRGWAFGAGE